MFLCHLVEIVLKTLGDFGKQNLSFYLIAIVICDITDRVNLVSLTQILVKLIIEPLNVK